MNGFRVTILVLFCLTVGLMFYAVTVVLPAQQERYNVYRATEKSREYEQREYDHRLRMEQLAPEADTQEVKNARESAAESERQREQAINEAEESSVIASAKRKQEEREALAAAQAAREEENKPISLGSVKAFDAEWNVILFLPQANTPVSEGLEIAVCRGGKLICEAVVDGKDEQSGQVSATIKQADFGATMPGVEIPTPQVGDEVIISPFESSKQLRMQDVDNFGTPGQQPAPQQPNGNNQLPEVEATLTPIE